MSNNARASIPTGLLVVEGDGRVYSGDAAEVVRAMQERSLFDEDVSLREYIDRVFARLSRLAGVPVCDLPPSDEGAARALLSALVRQGVARVRGTVLH